MQDASCTEVDPEAFFPDKGGSTKKAKEICSGCAVDVECLAFAIQNRERFGIWGGLSERERRPLLPPVCHDCGADISGRDVVARYCEPCIAKHRAKGRVA